MIKQENKLVNSFEITGIKCDTKDCTWSDEYVQFIDFPKYINKPCPVCSNSLLTEKEYNNCIKMYKRVDIINNINNYTKWLNPLHYYRLIFGDNRKSITKSIRIN